MVNLTCNRLMGNRHMDNQPTDSQYMVNHLTGAHPCHLFTEHLFTISILNSKALSSSNNDKNNDFLFYRRLLIKDILKGQNTYIYLLLWAWRYRPGKIANYGLPSSYCYPLFSMDRLLTKNQIKKPIRSLYSISMMSMNWLQLHPNQNKELPTLNLCLIATNLLSQEKI